MIARANNHVTAILTSFPLLALVALLIVPMAAANAQQRPQLGKSSIAEVINAMTVEEKVELLVGMGMNFRPPPRAEGDSGAAPPARRRFRERPDEHMRCRNSAYRP
jgi:beta-glucosidase